VVRHLNHTASRWALLPVLLVVWLAPFLGGSVEPWAMAAVYGLLAVLFVWYPVTAQLKRPFRLFLYAVALLPLLAFLPVSLTGIPAWRADLMKQFAIPFPGTITPQPWLTFDAYLAWLGGLAWIYWLAAQGWTREVRKPLAELFVIGMMVLTVVGLIGYHTRHPLPFWHAERLFGPFPNRNQTADLLALTFVVLTALLHMAVLKKFKIAPLWGVGLLVVGYGLVVNFSRAGILLSALGVAVYWLVTTLTNPSRKKIWIGLASLALVLALFLAFGGDTLHRFGSGSQESMTTDFRRLIFRDTLTMTAQHPWFGLGLSSFPAVFPLFRKLASVDSGIIHPESDWLWLAAEIGWPGTLLILGGALWLVWRAFVGAFKRPHPLRLASAICAGLFVLHGFFDVSGHRFGTLFPACFLFCLAWPGQLTAVPVSRKRSYGVAIGLVLVAISWLRNSDTPALWPGRPALAAVKEDATLQIAHGHGEQALPAVDAALRWAPLDWQLYYQRGASRILLRRDWAESLRDFQRANYLERYSPIMPENEGIAWLSYRPELSALSWSEALRRMTPEEGNRRYARYLEMAAPYPRLRSQLIAMGGNDITRSIIQLNHADFRTFPNLLAEILRTHPQLERLSAADQRALFSVWVGKGNPADAAARIQKTPALLPACNIPLAEAHARLKNHKLACEIAFKTVPAPKFPALNTNASEANLKKEFFNQHSLGAGMALYDIQLRRKEKHAALSTLQHLQTFPDAPIYIRYFEAQLHASNGNWEEAWSCLDNYIFRSRL
jgi:O-antigen ligase